jgi:hypothetical protein
MGHAVAQSLGMAKATIGATGDTLMHKV